MNDITYKQLKSCTRANIGNITKDTKEIIIKKFIATELELHKCYLVKLSNSLTNPPANSQLVNNWNNGKIPEYSYYKIYVLQILGVMVKVNAVAYDMDNNRDLDSLWDGWFPKTDLTILEVL